MELIQRYQLARDASSGSGFNNLNSSWIVQHKKTLLIVAGGLIAVLVFLGGFFAGDAYRHTNDEVESVLPPAPRTVLPSIKWDGVCPQKSAKCPKNFQGTPPLILVSLDGFHPDYLKRGFTPTINKIAQCGANADFLYPVFPSKTFPNHYSIVTAVAPHTITPAVRTVCCCKAKGRIEAFPMGSLHTNAIESGFVAKGDLVPFCCSLVSSCATPLQTKTLMGGARGNTCNGCRDPKCPSARCLHMVREDTEAPNEVATCDWMAVDEAVDCTCAFLTMWQYSG
ncbi:hypothetical protein TNCV_3847381 [Trichonephila clavipes]|nr:hypothetical protein TNCV_3847381 [Trichonephila clavipes]